MSQKVFGWSSWSRTCYRIFLTLLYSLILLICVAEADATMVVVQVVGEEAVAAGEEIPIDDHDCVRVMF